MNCADACDLLSEKLTGDLDAFRLAAVDEHLAGCPACRREMQELASLLASLNEGAEPLALVADPGPRYWDNFAGRVRTTLAARREERERRGIFAWFTLSRFAVAMSVLLIGMVAWRGQLPGLSGLGGPADDDDPLMAALLPSDPGMVQDSLAEMSSEEQSRFEQTLLADGLKDTGKKPSASPTPAPRAAASATPAKSDSKSTIDPADGMSTGGDDLSDLNDLTPEQLDQLLRSLNAMKT